MNLKVNDLEQRLKKFLDLSTRRRSLSHDSEELTEKIDVLLKEYNGQKKQNFEKIKDVTEINHHIQQRSQSFQIHKPQNLIIERPQMILDPQTTPQVQTINLKIINQVKLMIKPPEPLILLSAALAQLFGGCLPQICVSPFAINQTPTWQEVKSCLQSPIDILQAINEFQDLLNQGRIKKDNVLISMYLMNKKVTQDELQDKQIFLISSSISDCLKTLHAMARQHFKVYKIEKQPSFQRDPSRNTFTLKKQKTVDRSRSQSLNNTPNSISRKLFETQTGKSLRKEPSMSSTSKIKTFLTGSSSKKILNRSTSNSLPKYHDLQKRVQQANQKKIGRLDRILQLQVRKPKVESYVRQMIQGRQLSSSRSPKVHTNNPLCQQRQALQEELAQNHADIRALKHEELEIKWKVEREVKLISNKEEENQQKDYLNRSRQMHDFLEEQDIKRRLVHMREQRQKTNESLVKKQKDHQQKKSDLKENFNRSYNQYNLYPNNIDDTAKLEGLKSEYIYTQKQKAELETSLQKIISKINSHGLSDQSFSRFNQ